MKFVIGDIHGEVTKLMDLISNLRRYEIENLIFVGDYIDKGEDSRGTLLFLEKLSQEFECTFLVGNHEYAWRKFIEDGDYREFLLRYGGKSTCKDFGMEVFEPEEAKRRLYLPFEGFFLSLKKFIILETYIISHSGISPNFVEREEWDSIDVKEFLFQRYEFVGYDKMVKDRLFIFGHTAFMYPFYDGMKIGIDTGAAYAEDAPLTAFELDNRFFIDSFDRTQKLQDLDARTCPIIIREW
jgi:serine/threonine protein phosphatase 1